jgi:hypothetical protein
MNRIVLFLAVLALAALVFWLTPPRHNPFSPVDLHERPGAGTWHKLTRLSKNKALCFEKLAKAGVEFTPLADRLIAGRCRVADAVSLERSLTPYSQPLNLTCAEAAALYTWERHVARPAAEAILGAPILRIETYGSFSCRTVAGTDRLSEHARANAIDISGFRLEDGRLIDVKKHWTTDGPEAEFLRAVHKGGCNLFSVTLGPDYNAAHADHFHFDMGPGRACK